MMTSQPDQAEEAMLTMLAMDALEEAGRRGTTRCRFRRFQILARSLSATRRHLTISRGREIVIDADVDFP